jgi:serine/threonine protein kinase
MSSLIGRTLSKYKITERLGKGGMAEVYKAFHPKLERYVIIKVLHSYLVEGEDFLARFEREAKAVASLRHPHIVQIHDFDVEDDQYFMVMEFIDGGTLQERMTELSKAGSYMPAKQVLSILHQVGEALDFAHKHGIIHRDIKPSNILLDSSGEAFLTDFGIARMMGESKFTTTGALIGTPTYMSPEQSMGSELSAASDIYSLGIVLYELLTGKVPFTADTPFGIIHKHINEPLLGVGALRPKLPDSVDQIIRKVLEKEPQNRFQDALALYHALEKALTPEVISQLDGTGARVAAPISAMPTVRMDEPVMASRTRLPTVAMSDDTRAKIIEPVVPKAAKGKSVAQKPEVKKEKLIPSVQTFQPAVKKKASVQTLLSRLKSKPVILVIAGVIVVAISILILSRIFNGVSCPTIQDCQAQADQLRRQGDLEGYIQYIDKALDLVYSIDYPAFAILWCDRGDAERQLGQISQASGSYTNCIEWTQGNPELQPLRDRANDSIRTLP